MKTGAVDGCQCINLSGSAESPVWTPIDEICDDVTLNDGSDKIDASLRKFKGAKVSARAMFSKSATLPLERPSTVVVGDPLTADTPHAALLGASRKENYIVDLAFFDEYELNEDKTQVVSGFGMRMLAMVTATENQPFSDRMKDDFEVEPGRCHPVDQADYVDMIPLDRNYTFGD
jgi:hypothetical protein